MMSVTKTRVGDPDWMAFISSHPRANVFHHPAWADLLSKCYGYRIVLLTVMDDAGRIRGGLPLAEVSSPLTGHRLVALPFSDFCPPLVADEEARRELLRGLQSWRRQRGRLQAEVHWSLSDGAGVYPGESVVRHVTSLEPDPERVCRRFDGSVGRCIRQAERAGVAIEWGKSSEDLRVYYGLHLQTRKRLGTPVQPLRFFQLLWEGLLSQGLGFVLTAYKDSQPVAGAVFLHWNGTLIYKYGASDSRFWHLRPNNLLFRHAIRWGCEQGYLSFDWGKTDLEDEGLRRFKRGWGSEETVVSYSVLADRPPSGSASTGRSRQLLAALIRRSPPWVCRSIGELLYGHFA